MRQGLTLLRAWILDLCCMALALAISCPIVDPGFPEGTPEDVTPGTKFDVVCNTPSSALIAMNADGVSYGGSDKDEIIVDIVSQGPIPWSISRFNQGDLAPRLGPRWPFSQDNLGVPAPEGGSEASEASAHSVQAWRPHRRAGVMLASVAKNGQDWGEGEFFGTVATATGSGGYGYSMIDGTFGTGDCDIVVGEAGEQEEGNIDVAVAWLPYAAGFPSGYVAPPKTWSSPSKAAWQEAEAHSPDLDELEYVVEWHKADPEEGGSFASVTMPDLNSSEGMLFAIATDPGRSNNKLNIVGVRPLVAGGWQVQVHEDSDPVDLNLAVLKEWLFAFVAISFYGTSHLIAAYVQGQTGLPIRSAGGMLTDRMDRGRYRIVVPGKGKNDGVLLLQNAAGVSDWTGTSSAFLSYEWSDEMQAFEVQIRHVAVEETPDSNFELFPPAEVDFYVLWMDHTNPPVATRALLGPTVSWVGCYIDDKNRSLEMFLDGGYNTKSCIQACSGHAFAALQNSDQCFCSDFLGMAPPYSRVEDDQCGPICDGEEDVLPKRYCGGFWRNAIYHLGMGGYYYYDLNSYYYYYYYYYCRLYIGKGNNGNEYGYDYEHFYAEDSLTCHTVGEEGVGPDIPCVFPFIYKGVAYRSCTLIDSFYRWCATKVDPFESYIDGFYGNCSDNCTAESCTCELVWESPYCDDAQFGCPSAPCDSDANPWCVVSNPGCATQETGGGSSINWTYCAELTQAPGVKGLAWFGPLNAGKYCIGGLRGEDDTYRGDLWMTLAQCKAMCAIEETCSYITYYLNDEGCNDEKCLVEGSPSRCRLSTSCTSFEDSRFPPTEVFQKQPEGTTSLVTPSTHTFRSGLICGAGGAIAMVLLVALLSHINRLLSRSARTNLRLGYGRTLAGTEGGESDSVHLSPL